MKPSLARRITYELLRFVAQILAVILFRYRCFGRHHYPRDNVVLVCSNHQSQMDPVLVGLTCGRRMSFLARKSLFRVALASRLITFLGAVAIEREGTGFGGIKQALALFGVDENVLIFPEGTRTRDGSIAPFKYGICTLARKGRVPLVPVAIAGAFEAWPRWAWLPLPLPVRVAVGRPLDPQTIDQLDDDQLVGELQRRVDGCYRQAARGLHGRVARPADR